jgi:predicted nucleic acid-binding protein
MNGNKYVLDTCTIINFLSGRKNFLSNLEKNYSLGISIISEIEFLSSKYLSKEDITKYREFRELIIAFDISSSQKDFIDLITLMRKESNLKLPDCIIAATAIYNHASLITSDTDFKRIKNLSLVLI